MNLSIEKKMKIKVNNKKTKDTFYTLIPYNWLLRLFSLSCVCRKENQLKVSWSLTRTVIYVLVLGFINFYLLLNKIERLDVIRNNTTSLTFSDTIQMSYLIGYFEYTVDLFFVYKYGGDLLLKYFKCFDHVDQILGMTYYDEIRRIILRSVVICAIVSTLAAIIDYVSWIQGFGWIAPTLYFLDYFYYFLSSLTVLDGMTHVVQLEYRLKLMKELLQSYYTSPNNVRSISGDVAKAWTWRTYTRHICLESLRNLCHGRFIEAIGFNRCYLLLLEQTDYINSMFGFRFVVHSVNVIVNMINLLNVAIRFAAGVMVTPEGVCRYPAVSSLIRFLTWGMVAAIMVYRCESTYRESERILEIIDLLLVNKKNTASLTTTLVNFRNLLITRPIKFHALHFFTIEYTFMVSFTSTIVTYTIISVQSMK